VNLFVPRSLGTAARGKEGGGGKAENRAGERVRRLIGRRKLGRAVYFLFHHFRRAIIAHPVTAADAGIRGVYEMSKLAGGVAQNSALSPRHNRWPPLACVYLSVQSRRLSARNAENAE